MSAQENQQTSKPKDSDAQEGQDSLVDGVKRALIGGILAAVIALAGQWLVGQIYNGYEARKLIETIIPSANFLTSSIVTASATILALMLTMLSITRQTETNFDNDFFRRIEHIGLLTTISLSGSILVLLFLSVPLQESDNMPSHWFTVIYYVLIICLALLTGLIVAIVLMLFNAITSLIEVVRPSAHDDEDETEEKENKR